MEDHKSEVIENSTEEKSAPSRSRRWLTFTLLVALVAGMATSSALAGSVDPSVIGSYYLQAAKSAVGADAEEGKACSSKDKAAKGEGAACSSKDKEAKAESKECCSSKDKAAKSEETKEEAVQVSKAE